MPKKREAYGSWLKLDKPEHIVGFLLKSLQHTLRQTMDEAMRKQGVDLSFAHFGGSIRHLLRTRHQRARSWHGARWYRRRP